MKSRNKWLLALACACMALGVATGCKGSSGSSTGGDQTSIELNIVSESVELELFEEYDLQYTYTGEKALSWRVEDSSVVTVENGKLVALKEGETTVTVQVGKLSDICTVKVNGIKSELLKISVDNSQISLYAEETCAIVPTVVYDTKLLSDVTFSYESSDSSVVTVSESGVLTAKSVGNASIIITGNALGSTVGCMVNVTVGPSGAIALNTAQAELYALPEYEGNTYKNETQIQATVTEKGVQKHDVEIVWTSSNNDVATVENGKVVALSVGSAIITATYIGEDGYTVEETSFINVVPVQHTVQTMSDVIKTRVFTVDGVQTENATAYVTDGTLKVTVPNVAGGLDFSGIALVGETRLVLEAGNVLINIPIYLWTDGISSVEGLEALRTATDGHYRLDTDLDLTDVAWQYAALEEGENPITFKGVFDGGNHTLTNFAPINGGLFYELGNGAKVQNLKLENAVLASVNTAVGCIAASVAEGAFVTLDNISGTIIHNGNVCGGLLGRIEKNANVTIKNGTLHIYAANTAMKGGALVGCADSSIVMPNDAIPVIYASINLCGDGTYGGVSNFSADAINQLPAVKPTYYQRTLDIYDILEGGQTISLSEKNVKKSTLFANAMSEVEYSGSSLTIPETLLQNFVGNSLEVIFEKEDNTIAYYAISVEYGELNLTNANKELLKYAQGGFILLEEDIDLGGEVWTTSASFSGVLDGNGYALKNLVTSGNDSNNYGLFLNIAGEVKNIAFINVTLGNNSGVLAGRATAHLNLNNVFIQVAKTSGGRASATVERSRIEGVVINLTDVIIVMPKTNPKEYIYGYQVRGISTLTNVHCIGLNEGAYSETGSNYVALDKSSTVFHTDKISFNLELSEENTEISLSEFNQQCVEKYYKLQIVKVGQSNISDMLTLNGDEYVYLTEDVDLAGIEWNSDVTFTGTLEGNNHAIKNLTTVSGSGFFKYLGGTVKNVAFTNVTLVAGTAVLCYQGGTTTSTVENVFIQVAKTNSSGSNRFGVICERQNNVAAMNLTNVVIKMPGTATNEAIYGYTLKGMSSLTNVHCIGLPNEAASIQNAGTMFKGTYTLSPTLGMFASAEKELTTFLKDCVDTYLYVDLVMISQENVESLLTLKGDEEVILISDIDLKDIEWNSEVTFTGSFDGVNHTIKNLTTLQGNGFFKNVNGATIKNVAFTNVTLAGGSGAITYQPTGGMLVENTFIQVIATGGARVGAICERSNNQVALNLTNVVIVMPKTNANEAIYGYAIKGTSKLTNVHCIGLANAITSVANTNQNIASDSTYTLHIDLNSFNSAEKTLTDFLTGCVAEYLNK
ncbi:MAG: hypothetical protein E7364_04525 [Clostridiales bacterium]|nr:hypothetical protein [Clostridiales bacterium]